MKEEEEEGEGEEQFLPILSLIPYLIQFLRMS